MWPIVISHVNVPGLFVVCSDYQMLKLIKLCYFNVENDDHQPETMTEEHNGKATIKLPMLFLLPLLPRIVATGV